MKWASAPANAHSSASSTRSSVHLTASAVRLSRPSPPPDSNPPAFVNVVMSELPERPVLVLSTLDRFQLPASAVQIVSDFEIGPATDSADGFASPDYASTESPAQLSRPVRGQVTVTRLIVRILPSPSVSGHPAVPPNRAGWLVFQL